jgi:hypothetical protein
MAAADPSINEFPAHAWTLAETHRGHLATKVERATTQGERHARSQAVMTGQEDCAYAVEAAADPSIY